MHVSMYKKIISLFLAIILVVPFSLLTMPPKKAEAGFSSCLPQFFAAVGLNTTASAAAAALSVPVSAAGQIFTSGAQAGASQSTLMKDCIEHGLALAIGKFILQQMTQQIVTWINSGFEGKPAFISNPGQFALDIADQIAGEFILGSDLAFLCSPFKLQIQLQLALDYSYGSEGPGTPRCTLTQVLNNIDGAITNFEQQTWDDWFKISVSDNNNPYGSYLKASSKMGARIGGRQGIEAAKLSWGGGFLSWSECTSADGTSYNQYGGSGSFGVAGNNASFGGRSPGDDCQIQTPGKVIGGTLQNQLDVPAEQLGLADDLDKIFNALANQLFQTVISGAGGLLGANRSSGGGGGTHTPPTVQQVLQSACKQTSSSNTNIGQITNDAQAACSSSYNTYQDNVNQVQSYKPEDIAISTPSGSTYVQPQVNVALNKSVYASSIRKDSGSNGYYPSKLVNGDQADWQAYVGYTGPMNEYFGPPSNPAQWIEVDLNKLFDLSKIVVYQRHDPWSYGLGTKLTFVVQVFDTAPSDSQGNRSGGSALPIWTSDVLIQNYQNPYTLNLPPNIKGRYVRIQSTYNKVEYLTIPEMEVFANNPPIIGLKGQTQMTIPLNSTFTEPGYVAKDETDDEATLTAQVVVTGTVNTTVPGTYVINYDVKDSGGLPATTAIRTVIVK